MNIVTLGLAAILGKSGEPAKADFTQTGYTKFGLTYEDTAKMAQEDGESTEFYAEEEDDAIEEISKAGKITFSFSVMNPTLECLKRLFGGEVATDVWAYPDVEAQVEESLIILPKKGLLLIEVTATVMKPTTSGLKKLYVSKVSDQDKANLQAMVETSKEVKS